MALFLLFTLTAQTIAQSIQGLGVSGGTGSRGGIGDGAHPVRQAQSFITDAIIPTAPNTTRQLAQGSAPVLNYGDVAARTCSTRRQVIVDASAGGAQQEMVGFGHAWTDSTVSVFNTLEPHLLDQVMQDLFGQNGNNMGFMRHTIGSSDLSGNQYSYDDNGPSFNEGEPDPDLSHFTLGPDGTAMAQMIARMGLYKGDVFLFGSPWSYPGWMKNNDLFVAPDLDIGSYQGILNNSLNLQYIPQAVQYFTKYIDAFKSYGVNVNGLTIMNEPLNYQGKLLGGYPCMFLDAADQAAILNAGLGAALHDRGVMFMAYDHNTDQPAYPYRVFQGAPDYADAAAWHCYQGPYPNYTVLNDLHYAYPNALQFMTECSNYLPAPGSVNFEVASNFIPPVQHGASGAAMWVMATNPDFGPHSPYGGCAGCLGSIVVNSSTEYTRTNDYYMIGQFSRFVRRGAVNHRVLQGNEGSAMTSSQFYVMAVQNPDLSWAVIFMNNYGSDQDVVLSFSGDNGTAQSWEGTVPNATVVTWLLPSRQILGQSNGTSAASTVPPYPYGNGTAAAGSVVGTGTSDGFSGTCPATSSASVSSSSSSTVIPVPNTTHTIATASTPSTTSSVVAPTTYG